ncbi:NADAR family protein [Undibacterium cyanobacteriorum]|uniref:NADAR family protein n=1 Tax=Undibacterium cyanobacteriorum TaxID=3073561 RepID=A0ABY9RHJ2_9BURK|nr:NADAR family protein [Undibacterium sp. 20NA77.5]WMW80308.1 NADAR family protein [Undibacterium sp. 20NA77.5]
MKVLNKQELALLKEQHDFLFFWGHQEKHPKTVTKACLSQWYPARFQVDGQTYISAEQYMMAAKAKLFKDQSVYDRILLETEQGKIKALGRQIKGFDETIWTLHRLEIVCEANLAKFSQNPALKNFLLNTGNRILVEASPVDFIWGIGLSHDAPEANNPDSWLGENLLGFCLMEVRRRLSQAE